MALLLDQALNPLGATDISRLVVANDFTLTSNAQLTGLRVWLRDGNGNDNGVLDSFGGMLSFGIFADSGGVPGALIYSSSVSVADGTLTMTDTGLGFTGDIVQVDLALSGGDVLSAGTYFFALHEGAWGSPYDGSTVWWADAVDVIGSTMRFSEVLDGDGLWDSFGFDTAMQIFGVAPPTVGAFDGDTVIWTEGDGPVALDFESNATVADLDSPDLSSGNLNLFISAGAVGGQDRLLLDTSGGITIAGDDVLVGGVSIGTISWISDISISISFGAAATTGRVETLLRHLTYDNTAGDAPTAGTRTISYTLSDGDSATTTWTSSIVVSSVNDAPTVTLAPLVASLSEAADTSIARKVADITITDIDGGTNALSLTGADAALFEIRGNALFLKAGVTLDFETNAVLDVTVNVDDASVGATPDDSASLSIAITDVVENITGNSKANKLTGNSWSELLKGKGGNDTIKGGGGDDTIIGGAGADKMKGGAGADVFKFKPGDMPKVAAIDKWLSPLSGKYDLITDFKPGTDVIDLSALDANTKKAGNQAFRFEGEGEVNRAGDLVYQLYGSKPSAKYTIVFGDTNGDGDYDFKIVLKGHHHLEASDFVL